jgi:16S rRNA (cytosine1402-N4)-methyltransferase
MLRHTPVMVREVLEYLDPKPGDTIVDCTFGAGGHTEALLERMQYQGKVIAIDADRQALMLGRERFVDKPVELVQGNFRDLEVILEKTGIGKADGFLFDLGISTEQLEEAERGFSFQKAGPLDMRMDAESDRSAADLVNKLPEEELARIFREGGEERWARRLARHIAQSRQRSKITTTAELAEIIAAAIPARERPGRINPATKAFQALRFVINDEINALVTALPVAISRSNTNRNVVVISYESRSDGVTKGQFRHLARSCRCPPFFPVCQCEGRPLVKLLTRRPVVPTEEEITRNPRSRSAKLRAVKVI